MSAIEEYKEAKEKHQALIRHIENSEHRIVKHDYSRESMHAKFCRGNDQGNQINPRLTVFLAQACDEKAQEIYALATQLSVLDVETKHREAQEEAIEFIKSTP